MTYIFIALSIDFMSSQSPKQCSKLSITFTSFFNPHPTMCSTNGGEVGLQLMIQIRLMMFPSNAYTTYNEKIR